MSAASAETGMHHRGEKTRDVSCVIEELGMGLAQIRGISIAYSAWLVASLWISLAPVITVCLADQLKLGKTERATLAAASFLGLMLGTGSGGTVGDSIGRRPAVLVSLFLMILAAIVRTFSAQMGWLLFGQLFGGFAAGFGWPPSIALASEMSTNSSRLLVQLMRAIFASMGALAGCIMELVDNPYFKNMHWHAVFTIGIVPGVLAFPTAWVFLRESPVFLANKGRHDEAEKILEEMRRLNAKPDVDIRYEKQTGVLEVENKTNVQQGWLSSAKVAFGGELLGTTATLLISCFTLNLVLYGHMYAFPIVAVHDVSSNDESPGMQSTMQTVIGIGICLIAVPLTMMMSRRSLLLLSWIAGIVGILLFVSTGAISHKTGFQTGIYNVGQNGPGACATFGFAVIYQLAVEVYPTEVASTAAGIVLLFGKLGGLSSSYIFAWCPGWQEFYDVLVGMASVSLVLSMTCLRYTRWGEDQAKKVNEETPLFSTKA